MPIISNKHRVAQQRCFRGVTTPPANVAESDSARPPAASPQPCPPAPPRCGSRRGRWAVLHFPPATMWGLPSQLCSPREGHKCVTHEHALTRGWFLRCGFGLAPPPGARTPTSNPPPSWGEGEAYGWATASEALFHNSNSVRHTPNEGNACQCRRAFPCGGGVKFSPIVI